MTLVLPWPPTANNLTAVVGRRRILAGEPDANQPDLFGADS